MLWLMFQALILGGVVAQKSLDRLQTFANDGSAVARRHLVLRTPRFDDLGNQPFDRLIALDGLFAEDDEAAICLLEELKQAIDNLGKQRIELERIAEVVGDVDQRPDFLCRLSFEEHMAVGAAQGGFKGNAFPFLGLRLGLFRNGRDRRVAHGRLGVVKAIEEIANANLVAVFQLQARLDLGVVDEGAVAAAHIFNEELVLLAQNASMFAAYGKIVGRKNDVAIGVPPQQHAILV